MKNIFIITLFAAMCISLGAQKSANLSYNLEVNKIYRAKAMNIQNNTMTMQGMEQNSEVKNTNYFSLKPLNAGSEFFMAEVHFDSMMTTNTMPPMAINSNDKGDISSENPVEVLKCIINRLANSTILVKMDYSGKVLQIMNYTVIEQNVLSGTDSLKGNAATIKPQLTLLINEDGLKGMIETVTNYLPGKEIQKGGKWETNIKVTAGGLGMNITSNYTMNEITKDEIAISGEIAVEPASAEPTIMNGAEVTNELRGIGKTTMKIDPETGWIIQSSSKSQMSGQMNIKMPGQSMQIPMNVISTGEVTAIN